MRKIQQGHIKHHILESLRPGHLKPDSILKHLKAENVKCTEAALIDRHIPEMLAAGLVELDDGRVSATVDGLAVLRSLNSQPVKVAPPKPENLVQPRTFSYPDTYDGAELRRNPGIPAERFAAFDLPSVFLGQRTWPDGRTEKLDDLGR